MSNMFVFEKAEELDIKEFNRLQQRGDFIDGPWKESVDGVYKDMVYMPHRRVFGTLEGGKNVWAYLNKKKEDAQKVNETTKENNDFKNLFSLIHKYLESKNFSLCQEEKEELENLLKNINNDQKNDIKNTIRLKKYMTDQNEYGYSIVCGTKNNIKHWDIIKQKWVNKPYILPCNNEQEIEDLIRKLKNTDHFENIEFNIKDIHLVYVNYDEYRVVCLDPFFHNDYFWEEKKGWIKESDKSTIFCRKTAEMIEDYLKKNSCLPQS